jgi:hypothetical protein
MKEPLRCVEVTTATSRIEHMPSKKTFGVKAVHFNGVYVLYMGGRSTEQFFLIHKINIDNLWHYYNNLQINKPMSLY